MSVENSPYRADLSLAGRQGHITYAEPIHAVTFGDFDPNSHIPGKRASKHPNGIAGLTEHNTAGLTPVVTGVLKQQQQVQAFRLLDAGGGAGGGLSDAYERCRYLRPAPELHNLGRAPIDPFRLVQNRCVCSIRRQLIALTIGEQPSSTPRFIVINPDDIITNHRGRAAGIFSEHLAEPFITQQHIGDFPNIPSVFRQRYDLVLDENGALYYTFKPPQKRPAIAERSYQMLTKEGALVMDLACAATRRELRRVAGPTDLVVSDSTGDSMGRVIVARSRSPIAEKLRAENVQHDRHNVVHAPELVQQL